MRQQHDLGPPTALKPALKLGPKSLRLNPHQRHVHAHPQRYRSSLRPPFIAVLFFIVAALGAHAVSTSDARLARTVFEVRATPAFALLGCAFMTLR